MNENDQNNDKLLTKEEKEIEDLFIEFNNEGLEVKKKIQEISEYLIEKSEELSYLNEEFTNKKKKWMKKIYKRCCCCKCNCCCECCHCYCCCFREKYKNNKSFIKKRRRDEKSRKAIRKKSNKIFKE